MICRLLKTQDLHESSSNIDNISQNVNTTSFSTNRRCNTDLHEYRRRPEMRQHFLRSVLSISAAKAAQSLKLAPVCALQPSLRAQPAKQGIPVVHLHPHSTGKSAVLHSLPGNWCKTVLGFNRHLNKKRLSLHGTKVSAFQAGSLLFLDTFAINFILSRGHFVSYDRSKVDTTKGQILKYTSLKVTERQEWSLRYFISMFSLSSVGR